MAQKGAHKMAADQMVERASRAARSRRLETIDCRERCDFHFAIISTSSANVDNIGFVESQLRKHLLVEPVTWYVPDGHKAVYESRGALKVVEAGHRWAECYNMALKQAVQRAKTLVVMSDDIAAWEVYRLDEEAWEVEKATALQDNGSENKKNDNMDDTEEINADTPADADNSADQRPGSKVAAGKKKAATSSKDNATQPKGKKLIDLLASKRDAEVVTVIQAAQLLFDEMKTAGCKIGSGFPINSNPRIALLLPKWETNQIISKDFFVVDTAKAIAPQEPPRILGDVALTQREESDLTCKFLKKYGAALKWNRLIVAPAKPRRTPAGDHEERRRRERNHLQYLMHKWPGVFRYDWRSAVPLYALKGNQKDLGFELQSALGDCGARIKTVKKSAQEAGLEVGMTLAKIPGIKDVAMTPFDQIEKFLANRPTDPQKILRLTFAYSKACPPTEVTFNWAGRDASIGGTATVRDKADMPVDFPEDDCMEPPTAKKARGLFFSADGGAPCQIVNRILDAFDTKVPKRGISSSDLYAWAGDHESISAALETLVNSGILYHTVDKYHFLRLEKSRK